MLADIPSYHRFITSYPKTGNKEANKMGQNIDKSGPARGGRGRFDWATNDTITGQGYFITVDGEVIGPHAILEAYEVLEECLAYFEGEWQSVGSHPASRFGDLVDTIRVVLYAETKESP